MDSLNFSLKKLLTNVSRFQFEKNQLLFQANIRGNREPPLAAAASSRSAPTGASTQGASAGGSAKW